MSRRPFPQMMIVVGIPCSFLSQTSPSTADTHASTMSGVMYSAVFVSWVVVGASRWWTGVSMVAGWLWVVRGMPKCAGTYKGDARFRD